MLCGNGPDASEARSCTLEETIDCTTMLHPGGAIGRLLVGLFKIQGQRNVFRYMAFRQGAHAAEFPNAYLTQNTLGGLRLRCIVPLGRGYLVLVLFPQVKTWGYLPSSLAGRRHRRGRDETGRVHSERGYRTNSPCVPTSAQPQFLAHTLPRIAPRYPMQGKWTCHRSRPQSTKSRRFSCKMNLPKIAKHVTL